MKKIKTHFILILILLFALSIRLIFFTDVIGSDDLSYYEHAYEVTENTFEPTSSFHSPRIGLIYPTAFFYNLFGINKFTSNLLPLITSLLSIIIIFYLGRMIFNEKVGLISAFLFSFFPPNVIYSTTLLPDFSSALFTGLSVFLFLMAENKKYKLNYLFSGISIGIAYLMKEASIFIVLFFIAYIFYKKSLKKEYLLVLFGFLIIFGFEMLYYLIKTSNPLYRYSVVQSQGANIMKIYYANYFGIKVLSRLFLHYPYVILTSPLIAYFYILFFISVVYCISKRKKKSYVLLLWIIPVFLYLNFGSMSLSEYIALPVGIRYLEIITIPFLIILSYFLYEKKHLIKGFFLPIALSLLTITSIYVIYSDEMRFRSDGLKEAKLYLESQPQKIVYTDTRSNDVLKYIFNYQKNNVIKAFNYYDALKSDSKVINLENVHDVYVLVNRKMINTLLVQYSDMKFPKEVYNPPENWVIVKTFDKAEDKLIIYYAP